MRKLLVAAMLLILAAFFGAVRADDPEDERTVRFPDKLTKSLGQPSKEVITGRLSVVEREPQVRSLLFHLKDLRWRADVVRRWKREQGELDKEKFNSTRQLGEQLGKGL